MRRILAVAALAALLTAPTVWAAGPTRLYLARVIRCTNAAGGASLFSSGVRRAQVRIMNLGNATIWVGQVDGTLTTANGWPIHAGLLMAGQAHALALTNTSAGMNCVTVDANTIEVGVLEELE